MDKIDSFRGKYAFLSNFATSYFRYEGIMYANVECAFQAAKTDDIDTKRRLAQYLPKDAKHYGRTIPLRADWEEVKVGIMKELLRLKFTSPHHNYKQMLLDTGDAYLEEGNNHKDTFWGTYKGEGQNQLGKLLMELREEFRHDNSST